MAESYKTDPLDAAVESAWLNGIVVVAAAGNRGDRRRCGQLRARQRPLRDLGRGGRRRRHQGHGGRRAGRLVQPRRHAGRLREAGDQRPGRAHRVQPVPDSDFSQMCPTCIVSGQYIRAGGTSMAAPVVAGAVANLLQKRPGLTPNQVKAIVMQTARPTKNGFNEVSVMAMERLTTTPAPANQGLTPEHGGERPDRRDRLHALAWSRSRWSCSCRHAAVALVALELELQLLQAEQRRGRPGPVAVDHVARWSRPPGTSKQTASSQTAAPRNTHISLPGSARPWRAVSIPERSANREGLQGHLLQ